MYEYVDYVSVPGCLAGSRNSRQGYRRFREEPALKILRWWMKMKAKKVVQVTAIKLILITDMFKKVLLYFDLSCQ